MSFNWKEASTHTASAKNVSATITLPTHSYPKVSKSSHYGFTPHLQKALTIQTMLQIDEVNSLHV